MAPGRPEFMIPDDTVVVYWDSSAVLAKSLRAELPELTFLSFEARLATAARGEGLA